ncbi:unnamed protein product [Ectocarpus fasciculatus]
MRQLLCICYHTWRHSSACEDVWCCWQQRRRQWHPAGVLRVCIIVSFSSRRREMTQSTSPTSSTPPGLSLRAVAKCWAPCAYTKRRPACSVMGHMADMSFEGRQR